MDQLEILRTERKRIALQLCELRRSELAIREGLGDHRVPISVAQ